MFFKLFGFFFILREAERERKTKEEYQDRAIVMWRESEENRVIKVNGRKNFNCLREHERLEKEMLFGLENLEVTGE